VKHFLLLTIILTGCLTNYKIPSKNYDDKIISTSKNIDGTTTYKFYRHDLEYVDIAKQHKLLERKVYDHKQIIYRYPILETNVKPSKIFLKSGNDFLIKTGSDTIVFINDELPVMNRHFWGKGVVFSRITENSYLIKPSSDNTGYARFYISTSHNYEEINNDKGFIADSLVLPIR
jgi:hypothetical protein